MPATAPHRNNDLTLWALAGLMLLVAFVFQYSSTSGTTVPAEEDFYRDLGAANGLLREFSARDPNLLGEVRWYNPLIPWLIATMSRISGTSAFDLYTHAGVFLNLLGPIALFLFTARLWSLRAACFALAAYLFLGQHDELTNRYATYSPWPWPYNFTQGPALLTLVALQWALRRESLIAFIASGALLGLTFLSHTAPATIIALAMILLCIWQCLTGAWKPAASLLRLVAVGAASLLVASPLLLPLFLQYRFHTLNAAPAQFAVLYLGEVVRMAISCKNLIAVPTLFVLCFALLFRRPVRAARPADISLFIAFVAASAGLFAYGMGTEIMRSKGLADLPVLVPTFHFYLYVTLCLTIAFGIGMAWLVERAPAGERVRVIATPVLVLGMIAFAWPGYSANLDTARFVKNARMLAQRHELKELYDWCLTSSDPDDVFLADDFYGQYGVGAAGRKLVVLDPIFTSPYVDQSARAEDRRAMYKAIAAGDEQAFSRLADRYRIRYVLAVDNAMLSGLYTEQLTDTRRVALTQLQPVRSFGAALLYERIRPPP
jgi:hypothetical protein